MPEGLALALAAPGLPVLLLAAFVAGTVYGFAGFGAALIFMPVATAFLPAPVAIAAFSLSAGAAFVTVVPGAWAVADRRTVLVMIAIAVVFTPVGVRALGAVPGEAIRTAVVGHRARHARGAPSRAGASGRRAGAQRARSRRCRGCWAGPRGSTARR
jgi:uncharacterized protein